jgi:putative membrane protein
VVALSLAGAGSLARADGDHGDHGDHHKVSAWDQEWLKMSIEGDRFEIAGGKLAQDKATTPEVKALGARLVKDHSKSLKDAVELAKKLGVDVPGEPSPTQQWELKTVASFSGKDFDRRYSDLEVQDHKEDIEQTKDEIDMGTNPDVRDEAKTDLPMLQEHLKLSQDALEAAGGNDQS